MSKNEPVSQHFWRALTTGGSPVAQCDLCSRIHFNGRGEYMEEGELEELKAKLAASPDRYVQEDGQIEFGEFAGKRFVVGCDCGKAVFYERLIWDNRTQVMNYLLLRTQHEADRANEDLHAAKSIDQAFL